MGQDSGEGGFKLNSEGTEKEVAGSGELSQVPFLPFLRPVDLLGPTLSVLELYKNSKAGLATKQVILFTEASGTPVWST